MWLKFAGMVPVLRTESEASTTSSPTMFQKDLKKVGDISSGQGLTKASYVSMHVQLLLLCIPGLELNSFGV